MRWRDPLSCCCLFLLLSGCGTATQSYKMTQKEQAMYDYFTSQGFDKNAATIYALNPSVQQTYFDDKKCQGYGAKPGSDAYVACRSQLEAASKSQPPTVAQSGGGGYYAAQPVPASDAPALQNIIPPTVRCQSVPAGMGTVQTVCR